jgi:hypothetical protein
VVSFFFIIFATEKRGNENGNGNGNKNENENENKTDSLIDAFINNEGKITLQEELEYTPEEQNEDDAINNSDEYLTETLAGIYIKQGRYKRALDIMERINEKSQNRYYEDQKRFLQLLIENS